MSDDCKTLGQVVDQVADSYFARGCDAFTANLCALRDVQHVLLESVSLLSGLLDRLAAPKEDSGNE